MISFSIHPQNKNIFNKTEFFYISVRVKSFCSCKSAQCFACQHFGHSSLYCGYASRCIKCSGPHLAKDCFEPHEAILKCASWNGDHTSNYDKCPFILLERETRRPIRPNTSNLPSNSSFLRLPNKSAFNSNRTSSSSHLPKTQAPSSFPHPR